MKDNGKVFAGPRLKRFRRDNDLTQAEMATELGISASYLNLMEHNQRPVTATILLKLATVFDVNLATFESAEEEQLLADLEAVFTDPLLSASQMGIQDRKQMAMEHPEWAEAFVKIHRAYRSGHDNLSALAASAQQSSSLARLFEEPLEEVRDFFAANKNYFHALDTWAESKAASLDLRPGQRRSNLLSALQNEFSYRVVERPSRSLAPRQSLWDPHNRRLSLALGISSASKAFRIAQIYCRLSVRDLVNDIIRADPGLQGKKAQELATEGLLNYTAAALVLPYSTFHAITHEERFDVDGIADRLGLSFEQAAHRMSTLHRPGQSAPPFFFLKLDAAGNVLKRLSNGGFGFPRQGNLCPAWSVFKSQRTSGETQASMVKLPNGQRFLSVAHHQSGKGMNTTVVTGCEARFLRQTAYADAVTFDREDWDEPIGPTCRLCSREACASRALPMY